MQLTINEKIEKFVANIDKDEFLEFYYSHNDNDVISNYGITYGMFKKLKQVWGLKKTEEQIRNIQKNTWQNKPTSLQNKHLNLISKISFEQLKDYYINDNNTFDNTLQYFHLSNSELLFLIQHYSLYKDKRLSKVHADATKQNKYGDENYNNRERAAQTCLEKYNVDNPFKNVERVKQGVKDKYGVEHPCQNEEIKEKLKNTMYERYGGFGFGSNIISEKITQTNIGRYGVENPAKSDVVKDKIRKSVENTFMTVYGSTCYFTSPNRSFNYNSVYSSLNKKFATLLNDNNVSFEQEFVIGRYSYDFRVNDKLVEINPFATHNSTWSPFGDKNIKSFDYHFNKTLTAKENGYRCINVWDWDNVDKIISLLKDRETVYARKCEIRIIDNKKCKEFLNEYHLQGYSKSEINIALYYCGNIISVMTFGKPRYNKNYEYELIRYCSCYNVIGGVEKLFSYFIKNYSPKSIISYCDNSKFEGKVYKQLNFVLRDYGKPSKHWYNPKTMKHITDNLLRQRGFDQLLGKEYGCYGKGTSNEELMLQHGFVEIFDCGQSSYIWEK